MNDQHHYSRHSHQPLPSPRSHPSHIHPAPAPSPSHSHHTHSHPPPPSASIDRSHDRHSVNMTRHDSYQYVSSAPRAPPPLRTAQSFAAGSSSSLVRKAADKDDPDELTTKGRKRKRLAKACSACHKNKRRCDGFAPCSNCEFSSRPCLYLNAQGEPIPPPRTRDSSDTPAIVARIGKDGKEEIAEPRSTNARGGNRLPDALDAVDNDPNISLELIDHFFHQCHPLSGMFHTPTFYDRLYRNVVSPVLLDTMYAMSCRYVTSPAFLACFPAKMPPHMRAHPFIERARSGLDRLLTAYRHQTPEETARNTGTWEETETVQACVILSLYLSLAIQTTLGLYYADTAREMLALTPAGLVPAPTAPMGLSKLEHLTLLESRNRTYWCMSWNQKCWIAIGRPKEVHSDGAVPLPGAESWWSRFGGSSAVEEGIKRRDSLTQKLGDWSGEEGQVGELGFVMKIMDLATRITALAGSVTHGSQSSMSAVSVYQDQLKTWAQDLPPHLRFDERNLAEASKGISSPMHHTAIASWLYAYMHALAECSMFFLQAIVALQPGSPYTAERQGQAVENLGVIIEALGPRGRACPMVIFPLSVVTNWQDHVKSCGNLTTAQRQFDDRLNRWWADHEQTWGIDRRTSDRLHEFGQEDKIREAVLPFTLRGQYETRTPTSAFSRDSREVREYRDIRDRERPSDLAPRDTYQVPPSAKGWSQMLPSPPNITDTGTTSSWTLPPPTPGSASYGLGASHSASISWTRQNLPGMRPRAQSNASPYSAVPHAPRSPSPPSGGLGKRHLPSMSALNDRDRLRERDERQDGFRLPPLNELRMALKSPGEIGRHDHSFNRMTPSPRMQGDALGLSTGGSYRSDREREKDRLPNMNRDREWPRDREDRERERDSGRHGYRGWDMTPNKQDRYDKSRQQASLGIEPPVSAPAVSMSAPAASGIDALLTAAASEQKREEDERRSRSASAGMRRMSIAEPVSAPVQGRKGYGPNDVDEEMRDEVELKRSPKEYVAGLERREREVSPRSMA